MASNECVQAAFSRPFTVRGGRIVDGAGQEVRLWGVNYYAPFHHNYANLRQKGVDHLAAIDRDLADMKRLGVQLIRMHLFDREFTDFEGAIVENDHLRVFDYLLSRCQEEGIYVMITSMVWYNSCENQISVTEGYAYWDISQSPAFGFSNFFPKHMMLWHPRAMDLTEKYLRQLFARKNRFNGLTLPQMENIIAVEVINEPTSPSPAIIEMLRQQEKEGRTGPFFREEVKLVSLYEAHLAKEGLSDTRERAAGFCASLVRAYMERMFGVVRECFGDGVLRSHIEWGFLEPALREAYQTPATNCFSVNGYAKGRGFDSIHANPADMLSEIRGIAAHYETIHSLGKGLIAYEFDIQSTLTGFSLAALGHMMAAIGIQLAAYFTYTPADLAEYNPGWIVEPLSLRHTPVRAASFAAGGELFRRTPAYVPLPEGDMRWEGEGFTIDAADDLAVLALPGLLIHSGDTAMALPAPPRRILGRGSSPYIRHAGNGCYFIERVSEVALSLLVLPDQFTVGDPFRGKSFRAMANRFVDINREPVVSRLRELGSKMTVLYPGFENAKVERRVDGAWRKVQAQNNTFRADPGEYRIISSS